MAKLYQVWNGASVTTAAPVPVTTGTAVKTMIQLATSASSEMRLCEWWWEADGSAAATPGVVELMFANNLTTPATVTAYATADIKKYEPNQRNSLITVGTTASGYTASAEGTPVAAFSMPHQVPPTSGIYLQWPLGREPELPVSSLLRIRNKLGAAVNAIVGATWEE